MTNLISRAAEEWYGIKADPDNVNKLHEYLCKTYGAINEETIRKVFLSGEAAAFLTVNETYFFREPAHFSLLKNLLPSFEKTGIKICSAATSTGCEAYSLALLIKTFNIPYHIDAFDINPKVIEAACSGIYGARAMREDGSCFHYLAEPYIKKSQPSAEPENPQSVEYHVDASLKKNINFFVHNIMKPLPQKELYDFIFFRNAFIYLSAQGRKRILSNLSAALKEGGLLFLGVSETAGAFHTDFSGENTDDVFYFKKTTNQKKLL
ncbi:MAG: hypothetical protein LBI12_07300 [Treponema sp.]|jgi:chemotaxis protein methyltransferase CheR|nr:hypothetical protein [Treponema sp.]